MRGLNAFSVFLLIASLGWGQSENKSGLAPEVLLLARIKAKVEANLRLQPDYTCVETIERSTRRGASRRYRLVDTLRLEVALVSGKELFSWPGAREFKDQDIRELVPAGAIGTGGFALHARSVFLSRAPTYTYAGEEEINGRRSVRYDYRIPLLWSNYYVRLNQTEAKVGHHGSFWVDANSLDLVRLDIHADDIPPKVLLSAVDLSIVYERMRIGDSSFLLPASAVTTLTHTRGDVSRNVTRFSGCRQYKGESFVCFCVPPPEAAPKPPVMVSLPAGLRFELVLRTPIISGQSVIGDALTAVVPSDVKRNKRVVIPKGAVASGRLLRLEKVFGKNDYTVVAIQFDTLAFDNKRARLVAKLTGFPSYLAGGVHPTLESDRAGSRGAVRGLAASEPPPGVGVFYVKGGRLHIQPGARTIWRTLVTVSGETK